MLLDKRRLTVSIASHQAAASGGTSDGAAGCPIGRIAVKELEWSRLVPFLSFSGFTLIFFHVGPEFDRTYHKVLRWSFVIFVTVCCY